MQFAVLSLCLRQLVRLLRELPVFFFLFTARFSGEIFNPRLARVVPSPTCVSIAARFEISLNTRLECLSLSYCFLCWGSLLHVEP